jgi:hypothetical protein
VCAVLRLLVTGNRSDRLFYSYAIRWRQAIEYEIPAVLLVETEHLDTLLARGSDLAHPGLKLRDLHLTRHNLE